MARYQVLLTPELETAYLNLARELGMSMEQTLTASLQLCARPLSVRPLSGFADDSRLYAYLRTLEEGRK